MLKKLLYYFNCKKEVSCITVLGKDREYARTTEYSGGTLFLQTIKRKNSNMQLFANSNKGDSQLSCYFKSITPLKKADV